MKRIIEDLIEKRKKKQEKLKKTLNELGELIESKTLFNKKKGKIKKNLTYLYVDLNELITIQDKEWDAYSNNHSTSVFKSLQWKIEKLEAEYSNVKTILMNFISLERSLQKLINSIDKKTDKKYLDQLKEIKGELSAYQYSDFEKRFRGDENQVKKKLKRYLSIFSKSDNILDIGCGRGEFVELLTNEGKTAKGIDISESMLNIAKSKGIECSKIEALQFLRENKDNSIGGIFSSQVIEHFKPEYLKEVVIESFRVLKRNSPVVFETINPLSIFALSNIYFLDVTHQKPLHPEYMRYLFESSGFSDVKIIYSDDLKDEKLEEICPENQIAKEFNTNIDKLNKILFASPMYAVKGIKA